METERPYAFDENGQRIAVEEPKMSPAAVLDLGLHASGDATSNCGEYPWSG